MNWRARLEVIVLFVIVVGLCIAVAGCGDLLAPGDPQYEETCVIELSQYALEREITQDQWDSCARLVLRAIVFCSPPDSTIARMSGKQHALEKRDREVHP